MAMNGNTLGTAIADALKTAGLAIDSAELPQVWQVVATEIISHMVANAVITTTVAPGIALSTPDTINGATLAPGVGTGTIA